jgi:large subunit ribosomal protein L25
MATLVLKADPRTVLGKQVKAMRRAGQVPAVLYGAGVEPTPIVLDAREATRILARTTGATLIDLEVNGETHKVLVRETQRHSIRRDLRHVDFLKVAMDQLIRAEVPIELTGEAPAVKTLGGVLVAGIPAVEVEALPANLPDRIQVDLSVLAKIDDTITVADLSLAQGVRILNDSTDVIVHVIYMAEEVLEAPKEAVATTAEPEVISRPTKEGEEEEEEEG